MGLSTLSGKSVTHALAALPAWGCWYAEATIDGEHTLAGAVDLVLADLTLKGFVLSGGPDKGRSYYRIVGGKGGWGKTLKAKSYANDASVTATTVLGDAAKEAGETLDATTVAASSRVGPAFVRPAGPASRVLEMVSPSSWYVGEDGVTRLGRRAAKDLTAKATRVTPLDKARGKVVLAAESIATIVPGVKVDGLEAVDVHHEVTPKGLRSTIWGRRGAGTSRRLESMRKIVDALDPDRAFRAMWEYRVVTQEGERLNLQPVHVSFGMPDLRRVPVHPGISGAKSMATLGSRVVVAFLNADPGRPVVVGFESPDGSGFKPIDVSLDATTFVKLADGLRLMAATGDLAGGILPIVGTTRIKG